MSDYEGRVYAEIRLSDGSLFFTDLFADEDPFQRSGQIMDFFHKNGATNIGGYLLRQHAVAETDRFGKPVVQAPFDPDRNDYFARRAEWCYLSIHPDHIVSIVS